VNVHRDGVVEFSRADDDVNERTSQAVRDEVPPEQRDDEPED
jgi:hypothetical protein